jgi:hypothetical protein
MILGYSEWSACVTAPAVSLRPMISSGLPIRAPLGRCIEPGNPADRFVDTARINQFQRVQRMGCLHQRLPHRLRKAIECRPAIRL